MAGPILTVDFKGLCAFVGNGPTPQTSTSVDVLMFHGEGSKPTLCRHDPVVLFRSRPGVKSFDRALSNTKHTSFQIHLPELSQKDRNQDIGVWDIAGEHLALEGLQKGSVQPLTFDPTYSEVLNLSQLTGATAHIKKGWLPSDGLPPSSVAARLTIDHGVLSGGADVSAGEWAFEKLPPANPPTAGWLTFRQSVRWEVYGNLLPAPGFVTLRAGHKNAVLFEKGAHLSICNLCPLSAGIAGPSKDVIVYYSMAKDKVKASDRLVLYPRPKANPAPPSNGGFFARPGMDACPPLQAYQS